MNINLLSVNAEIRRFTAQVLELVDRRQPDIVCLQEASMVYIDELQDRGYHVSFLPRCVSGTTTNIHREIDGVLIATKLPHTSTHHYYFKHSTDTPTEVYDDATERYLVNQGVLMVTIPEHDFHLATTHFTWTPQGHIATDAQQQDMDALLAWLQEQPAHILCGDFNLARATHPLYKKLCETYTDNIPPHYMSSLDKSNHRRGDDPTRAILFSDYMVDYLFSTPDYEVKDVELVFGVSDHAAVLGTVEKAVS